MRKTSKWLVLLLVFALATGMFGLAGCGEDTEDDGTEVEDEGTEETTEDEGAEDDGAADDGAITSVEDLGDGDKVGVQSGTTGELWATENLEPNGVEVVPYDDILAAFAALQAGDVVGVINDLPISQEIAGDETRDIVIVEEIDTGEAYGFAFNQEKDSLREAVNWALAEIKADGTYDDIYEKWFGAPPMSIPESGDYDEPDTAAVDTLTEGKIIVGSDTAYPPFEFVEGGETVGFDVDLVKEIGDRLGYEVEFLTYKFDALITDAQAGSSFDMIASAMTITEDRAESVDFSDPYINSNQSLAVSE